MFKRYASTLVLLIGLASLLEAVGVRGEGSVYSRPYSYPIQRTPTLSRAYRYSNPYNSGYYGGGTTVVEEPTYQYPPPYPQGPYYPYPQGPGP